MERSFSFQVHDDDPSLNPLAPERPPQPPAHYSQNSSSETYADSGIQHNGTVIRKLVPPNSAAAAAAAAALAPVREDLASPDHQIELPSPIDRGFTSAGAIHGDQRYRGQELGYTRPGASIPIDDHQNAETPGHPSLESASASQALLPPSRLSRSLPHSAHRDQFASSPALNDRIFVDPVAGYYTDNPYNRMSTAWDPMVSQSAFGGVHDLQTDDEDEAHGLRGGQAAATTGGVIGVLGGIVGRRSGRGVLGAADASSGSSAGLSGGNPLASESNGLISRGVVNEKSEWLRSKEKSSKKLRWIIAVFAILFILGIAGGIAAAIILTKNQHSGSSQDSAAGGGGGNLSEQDDLRINGQLDKDSPEIKKIMANPDLHKVFPGIDYTPLNGVYPECLTWPPTQNNITRDLAVMSRLTDKIRLYSNDCNQTELVINAIDLLQIDMKVWMGVWLDGNSTTNTRQFSQMYTLLDDKNHVDKYAGIAVGNEVLFAESLTEQQLMTFIDDVRTNLTKLGYKIPIGTSDLGSKWTASMAAKVDVLMANVHPFFGGVTADKAANWTWNFFQTNDVVLTDGLTPKPKAMISEVGWPTGGGTNMGSVAGIDELNKFMSDFICTENARGTEYFWFSAFDEPWKIRYNKPGKEWEDKWGLMDVDRNLKKGLQIPSCN